MKKFKLIIISVILLYAASSCEDYLQLGPSSTISEESIFSNIDLVDKAVLGILAPYTDANCQALYMSLWGAGSDIENANRAVGIHSDPANYVTTEANVYLRNVWSLLYRSIEGANIFIARLPECSLWTGAESLKARQYYGEAVTLRAYSYFLLIQLWGDVPFYTTSSNIPIPKTDRDEIYEYLIKDLADVQDYVPWMDITQTTERVSKAFVKGLRARMALHYAGYSLRNKTFETRRGRHWEDYLVIANKECREIMESGMHQLNPSFENIFKNLHAYKMDMSYKEMIFDIATGRLAHANGWGTNMIGMLMAKDNPKYGGTNFITFPLVTTTPVYYYSFDTKDLRRDVSCELYNYMGLNHKQTIQSNACTQYGLTKWRRSWIDPPMGGLANIYAGINPPVLRYADIVLMFAETENEINGPTQAAKDALTLIRKRAFPVALWGSKVTDYVNSVSVDKETFFNAIVDERAWEFGGELIRKYDLIRWNLLGPKTREMKENFIHLINDDDPKYAHVPSHVFWKILPDGETIEILNPDYRLSDASIAGYTRTPWIKFMSTTNRNLWIDTFLPRILMGYSEAKNNHLQPISGIDIAISQGVLTQDQIP